MTLIGCEVYPPNYIRQRDYDDKGKPIENPEPVLFAKGIPNLDGGQYAGLMEQRAAAHKAAHDAVDKINNGSSKVVKPPVSYEPNPPDAPHASGGYDVQKKSIEIYDYCKEVRLAITEVHEICHRIDAQFALTKNAMLDDVMFEIAMSDSYRKYTEARVSTIDYLLKIGRLTPKKYKELADSLDYILSQEECFARAASQYIAMKSKNKALLAGIKDIIETDGNGLGGGQWTNDDFKGIYREMEKLFKALGIVK